MVRIIRARYNTVYRSTKMLSAFFPFEVSPRFFAARNFGIFSLSTSSSRRDPSNVLAVRTFREGCEIPPTLRYIDRPHSYLK